jgi:hypothetical protein
MKYCAAHTQADLPAAMAFHCTVQAAIRRSARPLATTNKRHRSPALLFFDLNQLAQETLERLPAFHAAFSLNLRQHFVDRLRLGRVGFDISFNAEIWASLTMLAKYKSVSISRLCAPAS